MTAPVYGCGLTGRTTCGPTTSCRPVPREGRRVRLLTVMEEYTRECLAIRAARSIRPADVTEVLAELMTLRGVRDHIRSDNGPEFMARAVREWLGRVGARTLYNRARVTVGERLHRELQR